MIPGKVVVPVVLVFVAAVVVIVLAGRQDTQAADPPKTAPGPGPLTSAAAARLADDVTSGDEKRVRTAVAVSPDQPLDAAAVSGLAAIRSMTFDPHTFRDLGNGAAEVTAQVVEPGDAQAVEWTVRLVAVDGKWLISSTEPAR